MKRIQIITGASSGLGKEYARQLTTNTNADELWLFARRKDRLEELAAEIAQQGPIPKVRVFPMDLSGAPGVQTFQTVLENNPESVIDTLVNNAGFGTYGPFAETAAQRQLDMIDINVYSLTGITHAALPYLDKNSHIINVASLASFIPLGNFAVYAATKAYVLSFSCGIAAELKDRGIHVTAVCPGPVSTEFAQVASNGARMEVLNGKDPVKVVAHSLRCAYKKRHIALMTCSWKVKAFMSRFVGRYFFARHTYINEKRPTATKIVETKTRINTLTP